MNEVIAPDVIAVLRAQPDTGAVVQPQPALLPLFCWHFQPLSPPQSLDTLAIDLPTRIPQQSRNPTIAVATVLAGKFDHLCNQALFVSAANGELPLSRTMLPQHTADAPLGYLYLATHEIDAGPATSGA